MVIPLSSHSFLGHSVLEWPWNDKRDILRWLKVTGMGQGCGWSKFSPTRMSHIPTSHRWLHHHFLKSCVGNSNYCSVKFWLMSVVGRLDLRSLLGWGTTFDLRKRRFPKPTNPGRKLWIYIRRFIFEKILYWNRSCNLNSNIVSQILTFYHLLCFSR